MGVFRDLFEKFVNRGRKDINFEDDDMEEFFSDISDKNLWELVGKIREIKKSREDRLEDYNNMMEDSIIQSAVELYADDATQTSSEKEKTVWVERREEEDNKVIKDLNEWLQEEVDIEDYIWTYAYHVVFKGQAYLRTFYSDERFREKHEVGNYFELVRDDSKIYELMEYGETIGYYVEKDDEGTIYPSNDFIHFISDRAYRRENLDVEMELEEEEEDEENEEKIERTFVTRYGTSFLEPARPAYKTLDLMESILIMSRIVRSAMYRIFQIEVGSAGKKKSLKIIREIRQAIESNETFNKTEDLYNSEKSPLPINSNVYSPKRNGKGQIEVNEVGGNVDIKNIVDIEYFRNKLFAALKIPKSFLGFEETLPGNIGNGTSLTKLDIRYARTVKRVQSILKHGIEQMCNFYLEMNDKKDKIGNFKVKMAKISSAEEKEKTEQLENRVRSADSLNGLISRDFEDFINKREFLLWLIEDFVGLDGLSSVVKDEDEIDLDDEDDDSGGGRF